VFLIGFSGAVYNTHDKYQIGCKNKLGYIHGYNEIEKVPLFKGSQKDKAF
jgi:hypothetical protein